MIWRILFYIQLLRDKINVKRKEYYNLNKDKINIQKRILLNEKYKNNNLYRITTNIRNLISRVIKNKGFYKSFSSEKILGCSYEEFKLYLESKFEDFMTWDNYGLYNGELNHGWDIDHIIPISTAKSEEDAIRLNHYTNLQPLCSYTNRVIKRNNL